MTMNRTFKTLPFALSALSALVLAGCAVGPTYTTPVDAPVAISAPERSLFADDAVQRDWWRQLDDAQLDALVERALAGNHDIRIEQGNSGMQPDARSPAQSSRAGFDASWEIDLFGRLKRLDDAATARTEASAADLAQVRTGRALEGDLASAQANLATTESQLPALETTRRQAAYRVAVKARVRGAEARAEGDRALYEQTVLRAIEDVEGALTGYGQNQLRLQRLAQASERSARAAELAEVRYREGAAPYLGVLDAQRTLLRAQDAVAEAETASYTSLVALYKALGGGWQAPHDAKGDATT
jgi:outer membrane protein TolC